MEKKERKITRASEAKTTVKKVEEKVQAAEEEAVVETPEEKKMTKEEKKKSATVKRIIAGVLWAVAICCEVLAILLINEKVKLPFFSTHDDVRIALWIPLAIFVVIDLACCIIAGFLWKKSNRLAPFKKNNNKLLFYVLSQLGSIMAVICFLPLIILILTNKNLDKKTKTFGTVLAAVALVIAFLLGWDFNPISQEEKAAAMQTITDDVYWSQYGRKYHLYDDCQTIRNSDLLTGSVQDAIDNGRESLCAFCAKRAGIDNENIKIEQRSDVEEALETVTDGE